MRAVTSIATVIVTAWSISLGAGCGGGSTEQAKLATPNLLHSPELNGIMKTEVNQPFSALMFLVFHADDADPDSTDLDYAKIMAPASTLRAGIAKVRAIVDPPVLTAEARAVFFSYVDSMVHDSTVLTNAVSQHERTGTEKMLTKISQTCNDCHHFFRLKIEDTPDR
jgi:hypothetical protein